MKTYHGGTPASYDDVRVALLQDLYSDLQLWGFNVTAFSSIDHDEIFICVSLKSAEAISYHLLLRHVELRIRKDVVRKLGVADPLDNMSHHAPHIRFDPRTVEKLYASGILESNDVTELFDTKYDKEHKGIVSGRERIRLIHSE